MRSTSSSEVAASEMKSAAVALKVGASDGSVGSASRRAFRWAMENLKADRFILVHVMPVVTSIPTPSGDRIPITEVDQNVVAMYVEEVKLSFNETFAKFEKLFKTTKMETLVIEDDNPATALLRYISESRINSLVLGSCGSNFIKRKRNGPGVPTTILSHAPDTCDIYVVSKRGVVTKSANPSSTTGNSAASQMYTLRDYIESSGDTNKEMSCLSSASVESMFDTTFGAPSLSELNYSFSHASSINANLDGERRHQSLRENMKCRNIRQSNSMASTESEQSDIQAEVEQLRLELQNTIKMYKRACEELVHTENKVQSLSSECLEEAQRVHAALEREEIFRKIASEEKAKHLQAVKEVDEAKNLLAKEAYERQAAELNALKESLEKKKIVDMLFSRDGRHRRYTREEIELATDFFSDGNVIGEGGYGKVYKCSLHCTPVAVKVLRSDAVDKKQEFLKEVEVLSQLCHPNIVLLLGACPDSGCLVYEYMENGSLEEHIFHQNGKPPLPWFTRFRIVFEIASGLAFLHNSKPEPIVHRDLKPGNILLDRNYVSRIGDVGMAKLISDVVPDNITEYKDSMLAGTLYYMDPEYQRTGTIRPKSDLYAFGVTTLQLLTGRYPNGLLLMVENAIMKGSFADILDKSVTDWPLAETQELALIALKCSKLRCRDRPDLDSEVLPILKRLADFADVSSKAERNDVHAPGHYYCPILQEIMDDPYIADDGFTYEYRAIKAWLAKYHVSPVTKLKLCHSELSPNHTLRSAIQEWRSQMKI